MLTREQKDTLIYFWQEKRDLERCTEFEKLKPLIKGECPQLLKAWEDYKTSIRIMNDVCNNL